MAEQVTKIDIFSGFLGAGKTTLIKKLIKEAFQGEKIVLIENEFGEIGIDGGFMREAGIQVNELNSGCICCSLVGDFREALKKVVETYHPDRILIEPSGVGKLSDVTRAVEGVGETLPVSLNSFVTVADVNKVKMYMKNFGEFYDDQISHASCIILSRTGSADEKKIAAAVALIQEKNPTATIVTTDWNELTGAQIVSVMDGKRDLVAELLSEAQASNAAHADEDEEEHHHHHHDHDEDGHECCHHHHDHDDDDDDEPEEAENVVSGETFSNIENLKLDIGASEVQIKTGTDDKIHVDDSRMKTENAVQKRLSDDRKTLEITTKMRSSFDFKNMRNVKGTLVIYLPRDYKFDQVDMEYGAVTAEIDGLNAKSLKIESGASGCTIKNADIEELDVETGAGSLDFYGTVEKEVDIDCGAGSVTLNLEGKVEDYNYELDSSAGSVEIGEDIDLGGLSAEKSIDNGSKRTIEISNGAGSVEIRFH